MGSTACTEPQCLYSRAIPLLPLWAVRPVLSLSACTVQLYLYSPYTSYSLYRASVPVQYSYTFTPLSACTVQLYLYSTYGPYGLYRASVPVQGCTLTFFCAQVSNINLNVIELFTLRLSLYTTPNKELIFPASRH